MRSENPGGGHFFQLLLQVFSKLNRRERLANRIFALSLRLITGKLRGTHAEGPNINVLWSVGTYAAVCRNHANVRSEIFRVRRSNRAGSADLAFSDIHVCARTEQQAGSNSDKRFHNFWRDRLLFPRADGWRGFRAATLVPHVRKMRVATP